MKGSFRSRFCRLLNMQKKWLSDFSGDRISVMSTVIEEVEAFRQYVLEHSRTGPADASLEDLFQRWYASRLSV